ncbi:hypothetical protein G6F66_014336 [Rhizopus arrhizus]|nr:hypothetical protein G6F66_014336 [Rhizopus arrhizus]
MRVVGQEVGGSGPDVGEIAAAAAGNADLLRQAFGMVDQHHAQAALAGHRCTHHASGAGAEYGYIKHQDSRPAGLTLRSGNQRSSAFRHSDPLRRPGRGCRFRSRGSAH